VWGDFEGADALAARDGSSPWEIFDGVGCDHASVWHAIEPHALAEWVEHFPGLRPSAWWQWSVPELRSVFGQFRPATGGNRCHDTGVPYGEPVDWMDRPMVESTPRLLDRLGLWLPGERARVAAAAFEPSAFDWNLTEAPPMPEGVSR
jgi:hypothetical protein